MDSICTKRSIVFYLSISFALIFFLALGTFIVYISFDPQDNGDNKPGGEYLLAAFGILIDFLAFYTVYRYFKNAPVIEVDKDKISFGSDVYYWKDKEDILLTGKQSFSYILKFPMEGAVFLFNNGIAKHMFDDMYSNAWQVKLFIQEVVINKSNFFELPDIEVNKAEIENDDFDTFIGSPYISFRGILFWGFVIFILILMIWVADIMTLQGYTFFALFFLIWWRLNVWLMHYFRVSQNFLVIRRHLFWSVKIYRLASIKEIVFEQPASSNLPNCMRVITKDFRNKLFPAGTLKDHTWLQLKEKLEHYGVRVRNECIYEVISQE